MFTRFTKECVRSLCVLQVHMRSCMGAHLKASAFGLPMPPCLPGSDARRALPDGRLDTRVVRGELGLLGRAAADREQRGRRVRLGRHVRARAAVLVRREHVAGDRAVALGVARVEHEEEQVEAREERVGKPDVLFF